MKKGLCLVFVLAMVALFSSCASTPQKINKASVSSVAIVSLGINNYGSFGTRGVIDPVLINSATGKLLSNTEAVLARKLTVKPAASFVKDEGFRALSIGKVKQGLYAPVIDGADLPSFSDVRREVVKGILKPETAKALCETLGVDAVVLVYSEWMIDSGKFIPTIKALTKNCFAMYGKDGHKFFYDRKDLRGDKIIGGAFAGVRINEDTIDQWIDAYSRAAEEVLLRHI
ncbi:hypothetical protein C2E25_06140 [Geothermobacter hydrogeniphilus]|uniref:Lipoprotein n=1 Tax=Geothermobacter hydrogeniphilus TaxID=1969733 RepID=A0A2K2HBI0_9BACT|nr:hypothetical protein [Geothermobacter hydrogeniphilus]PNU20621.1 hypothetical protein C2E25_06140 [Geothermobacter hydrogeniphilus]